MSPHLRIVKGNPTDEEVAALVAVVSVLGAGGEEERARPRSAWSDRRVMVREPLAHGPGAWRTSAFPR
ncbi:acyl-CoA carboxylase subunit epsilon [Actinophytocola sp.]|jgi:acyl-CoA carboxylase epsilon subunit|uniref:acyl-CoA carboxylase subunit epsilon n=1 Tax=Actinophytocola sp. TaxID=1872138 RepID=UPI002D4DC665|nr:acyl-CoA carboxylase subunit epsilon [Actinophytocola sp.]HYQ65573.1 acyl-CoA carboxylase subunit epsilon [Actinophytocola sp.]